MAPSTETVITALEDAEDYKAFEAAITADYDAQSAVERELVLRLASVLWRLRRATGMETGLFEIQATHLRDYHHNRSNQLPPPYPAIIHAVSERANSDGHELCGAAQTRISVTAGDGSRSERPNLGFARCFLRLANLPNFALDRLSRYEANLWRQVDRILFALDALDRRKPQERARRRLCAAALGEAASLDNHARRC